MKILIVDDHDLVRGGLRALLEVQGYLVLDARNGEDALQLIKSDAGVDVMFVDLSLPIMDGVETISACLAVRSSLPIIVLSSSEDPRDVRKAISAGAKGYVPKTASLQTLVIALDMVMQGDVYIPPFILNEQPSLPTSAIVAEVNRSIGGITHRQMDVLRLVIKGMSNKEIARELSLSEKTIKVHMSGIFRALNVVNRTQAVAVAQKAEIL